MKKYLVIGNPIEHSLSPLIHNYWIKKYNLIDCVYEKRKVEEENLGRIVDQIRSDELIGVNITVPFKKKIMLCILLVTICLTHFSFFLRVFHVCCSWLC